MKETLIFKKERDLGAVITDTFTFIRNEGIELLKYIIRYGAIPLALVIITITIYTHNTLNGFNTNMDEDNLLMILFFMMVSILVFFTMTNCVVLHYIKSYIKNDGNVKNTEISDGVKKSFWSIFGLFFVIGIILVICAVISVFFMGIAAFSIDSAWAFLAVFIFIIPLIYLYNVFLISYPINIFENKRISETIGYSFTLMKGEWWMTFLTFLVMYILYYIIVLIFQVPFYIYFFANEFYAMQEISADPQTDWIGLVLNAIGNVAQYLLYGVMVVVAALVYFNLNERKNFTGTIETIDKIGQREE